MSLFASLGGLPVTGGSLTIPKYGIWSGDVIVTEEEVIPTQTSIVIGNLTMACAVYRQAIYGGSTACRIVGGALGWRKTVSARQYALNSGVKLSLVLGDVASEVGESVSVPNDTIVGTMFTRMNGPASDVLRLLAGSDWYVDNAGVTQIQAWPTVVVGSEFVITDQDGARGRITVATEDYATWMPGCTFTAPQLDGVFENGGVEYKFSSDGTFRFDVLTLQAAA